MLTVKKSDKLLYHFVSPLEKNVQRIAQIRYEELWFIIIVVSPIMLSSKLRFLFCLFLALFEFFKVVPHYRAF